MRISEIFYSINGESTYAGFPFVIVRTSGCNLQCSYCDTPYASSPFQGLDMPLKTIVDSIVRFECPRVLLTGGEPLLQKEMPCLSEKLLRQGYVVLLETNGSLPIKGLSGELVKIVDLKCPSSGMQDQILWKNLEELGPRDQVKFVVDGRADLDWMYDVIKTRSLEERIDILVSPVFGRASLQEVAEFLLQKKLRARIQLQLHKYIWENDERK